MVVSRRVAIIISRLFDPVWIIPAMLTAAVVWSLTNGLRWRFLTVLILLDGFIPFIYFVHLLRTKEISDWDTTNRTERFRLYAFTLAVHAVGVIMAAFLGKTPLAKILLSFWVLALVFFLVTLVWKISLHTGVFSAAVAFAAFVFGSQWWTAGILLLPIGWSRLVMKKHTVSQLIVGAAAASFILTGMFRLTGLTPEDARRPSPLSTWMF